MLGLQTGRSPFRTGAPFAAPNALALRPAQGQTLTVNLAQILGAPARELEIQRPTTHLVLERQYALSAWVYICCWRKARDLASAPFVVTQPGKKENDREPLARTHPLMQLLRKANQWMTMREVLMITSIYLDLTGNAFWLVFRDRSGKGQPTEIYPLNPVAVRIFTGIGTLVDHYQVFNWGSVFNFRNMDLIHFKLPNPLSVASSAIPSIWGVGPLEAGWTLVITDDDAVKWNRNLVKNDGRPVGVLSSDQEINPEQAQQAAEKFREVFAGPNGAGKVLVTGRGLKYERMAMTAKELDYAKTRIALREQIIATFGLNSAVLGLEQGDVGKRTEMHRDYWEGTIVSTSQSVLIPPLNEMLAPAFGEELEVAQDFSGVRALQENEGERADAAKTYWSMGVPFNTLDRKFKLGFGDIPGGDIAYVPTLVVAAGGEFADGADVLHPEHPDHPSNQPPEPPVAGPGGPKPPAPTAPKPAVPKPAKTASEAFLRQLETMAKAVLAEQERRG